MLTDDKVTAIFCFVDDLLKAIGHREDGRRRVWDSEVITTGLVSALYFGGHHGNAIGFMKTTGLVPNMLGKSRFSRRVHEVFGLVYGLFEQVGHFFKRASCEMEYVIDSFPVPVCDNIRISRCRMLEGEQWRGWKASMRRYFYGAKVHLLVTKDGVPVEFGFVPGNEGDALALRKMPLELPEGSEVYADAGYTNYEIEDQMLEADGVALKASRKSNSRRKDSASWSYIKEQRRKIVETTISGIKSLFLRRIHAVTFRGWLLKITLFIFAFTLNKAL